MSRTFRKTFVVSRKNNMVKLLDIHISLIKIISKNELRLNLFFLLFDGGLCVKLLFIEIWCYLDNKYYFLGDNHRFLKGLKNVTTKD
jgi:hypothetical protein